MNEESRLRFQRYYHEVCKKRGWMQPDGDTTTFESHDERAEVARELFGLALIFGSDTSFYHVKEQLSAESLKANPSLKSAISVLQELSDEQKAALLTLVDDVLDSAIYKFTIQLDRFDHGHLSLRFTPQDDDCDPIEDWQVEIAPGDAVDELFQDAVRWRDEFSMGDEIGRPEDPSGIRKTSE